MTSEEQAEQLTDDVVVGLLLGAVDHVIDRLKEAKLECRGSVNEYGVQIAIEKIEAMRSEIKNKTA